ncbi:MAG: hypothetical protein OHK0015_29480 [Chloroflexi bacterium OHK40]
MRRADNHRAGFPLAGEGHANGALTTTGLGSRLRGKDTRTVCAQVEAHPCRQATKAYPCGRVADSLVQWPGGRRYSARQNIVATSARPTLLSTKRKASPLI